MKFAYYIVNLEDGEVTGTNDLAIADEVSSSEYYAVIDVENAVTMRPEDKEPVEDVNGARA